MSEGTIAQVLSGEATWACVLGDNADVLPTLPDDGVGCTIGDPPYDQHTSESARSARDTSARFIGFDGVDPEAVLPEVVRVTGRWGVLFCALEQLGDYKSVAGDFWCRAGVWVRTNSAPQFSGDRPGQGAEGLAIMHPPGVNLKRWNGHGMPAVWTGPTANCPGATDSKLTGHPTPKPLWLMLELVELFADPNEIILDPFAGSGTTGVACLRLGRRFIGIEREPKYHAVAVERLRAEERGLTLKDSRAGQQSIFDLVGP